MLHEIKNKEISVILKDEKIELPSELRKKIDENFENIKNLVQMFGTVRFYVLPKLI